MYVNSCFLFLSADVELHLQGSWERMIHGGKIVQRFEELHVQLK